MKHFNRFVMLAVALCVGIAFPQLFIIVLSVNLLIAIVIGVGRLIAASLKPHTPTSKLSSTEPFVSIHIACYNEPPELLIQTLKSVSNLNYSNYEVIVLDNNTPDEETWKPVQEYCSYLGDQFKFYHFDNVKGFKAGALNISYEKTSPKADYILVIDADYILEPNIINRALTHCSSEVGLVQFPQAYLNVDTQNQIIASEYRHFFNVYMNVANTCNAVLATGTVSFIRKTALEQAGLWKGKSITEDVDLGLNIHKVGYCGVFVNESVGKGLMPTELSDLSVQRERWVYGNMQTLLHYFSTNTDWNWKKVSSNILFLTAWFNFLFIPMQILAIASILFGITAAPVWQSIAMLAFGSICIDLLLKFTFFMCLPKVNGFIAKWQIFVHHIALAYEGAFAWIKVLFFSDMGFKRTNKFLGMNTKLDASSNLRFLLPLLLAMFTVFQNQPIYLFSTSIICFLLFLAEIQVRQQLKHTQNISDAFYQISEDEEFDMDNRKVA